MNDPKDITVKVTDMTGQELLLTVKWDTTYEEWKNMFKTILTFLEFGIPEGDYDRQDY